MISEIATTNLYKIYKPSAPKAYSEEIGVNLLNEEPETIYIKGRPDVIPNLKISKPHFKLANIDNILSVDIYENFFNISKSKIFFDSFLKNIKKNFSYDAAQYDYLNAPEIFSLYQSNNLVNCNSAAALYTDENIVWKNIENWIVSTKAKESIDGLLRYIEPNIGTNIDLKRLSDFLNSNLHLNFSHKSFVNFIRYYPVLNGYLFDGFYNFDVINNVIRLQISIDNLNLILHFNENFIIDYYSSDDDIKMEKERLIFSMNGSFSSSSTLRKSYKIERLLSVLDKKKLNLESKQKQEKLMNQFTGLILSSMKSG